MRVVREWARGVIEGGLEGGIKGVLGEGVC